jgi:hypothetical protein
MVTVILFSFATIGILHNISKASAELEKRIDNISSLAKISLSTPLWNLDKDVAADFIEALFIDESMAYRRIVWGDRVIVPPKVRREFPYKDISHFLGSADFIVKNIDDLL